MPIYIPTYAYEEEDTCMPYEEEDTYMPIYIPTYAYEEEDTCMPYEEEDTYMPIYIPTYAYKYMHACIHIYITHSLYISHFDNHFPLSKFISHFFFLYYIHTQSV
jgi:hypothetical protein